ncbi:uncharacterized protein ARMOST_04317 [Armillaria ostoyae]|uniref:Uncharacterized protein n=1 Tax=Armillaria ostoyae TaxID=47428 RepID=A0A284QX04_ARMOS|nr:uncharacterized protein ARMOST_04317 [Armillaria ostoyae]
MEIGSNIEIICNEYPRQGDIGLIQSRSQMRTPRYRRHGRIQVNAVFMRTSLGLSFVSPALSARTTITLSYKSVNKSIGPSKALDVPPVRRAADDPFFARQVKHSTGGSETVTRSASNAGAKEIHIEHSWKDQDRDYAIGQICTSMPRALSSLMSDPPSVRIEHPQLENLDDATNDPPSSFFYPPPERNTMILKQLTSEAWF